MAVALETKRLQDWKESPPEGKNLFVVVFRTDEDDKKGFPILHKLGAISERVVETSGRKEAWNYINRDQLVALNRHKDKISYKIIGNPVEE
ncbi:MAG: hypothetical protein KGI04_04110 [Candidatus Micrarchaeota archaeon]|nr:hypothetical protein [Candidatus Micrarchaeota archaeon]